MELIAAEVARNGAGPPKVLTDDASRRQSQADTLSFIRAARQLLEVEDGAGGRGRMAHCP